MIFGNNCFNCPVELSYLPLNRNIIYHPAIKSLRSEILVRVCNSCIVSDTMQTNRQDWLRKKTPFLLA